VAATIFSYFEEIKKVRKNREKEKREEKRGEWKQLVRLEKAAFCH